MAIVDTAVPFNYALSFLVFWLTNKVNSSFYFMLSQHFSSLRIVGNGVLEGKSEQISGVWGGGGGGGGNGPGPT